MAMLNRHQQKERDERNPKPQPGSQTKVFPAGSYFLKPGPVENQVHNGQDNHRIRNIQVPVPPLMPAHAQHRQPLPTSTARWKPPAKQQSTPNEKAPTDIQQQVHHPQHIVFHLNPSNPHLSGKSRKNIPFISVVQTLNSIAKATR